MRKPKIKYQLFGFFILLSIAVNAKADIFSEIFGELVQQTTLQGLIQNSTSQLANQLPGLQQQTINQLMNTAGLNFSTMNYNPNLQSWGSNASTWNEVLQSYSQGGSGVGSTAEQLNQQFPIQSSQVANPNASSIDAQYYTLEAQTALASRAASQYDYNNIQNQIVYTQQLLTMVPQTKTVKDSLDLQNRIQVENNLIQLEILRLSALSNQQQAIQAQGQVNATVNANNGFQ